MLHAVVIGIDEYRDPNIRNLSFAASDAKAIAKSIEMGLHPEDRSVHLLLNSEATYTEIRSAVGESLPKRAWNEDDVVLVYFAGHGSPETVGRIDEISRYLVAHDTEHDRIYSTGIDMESEMQRWFQRIVGPRLIVFFVDACFSGRAGGRTFEGPLLRRARSQYRAEVIRLRDMELGEGRVILSACDDNELAQELPELGHGVFTHALLQSIRNPVGEETTLGLGELYEQVRRQVVKTSRGHQQPVFTGRVVGARLPRLCI